MFVVFEESHCSGLQYRAVTAAEDLSSLHAACLEQRCGVPSGGNNRKQADLLKDFRRRCSLKISLCEQM